jgi:hypothetical protein
MLGAMESWGFRRSTGYQSALVPAESLECPGVSRGLGGVDRLGRNQGYCGVNRLSGDNTRMETDQVLPMLNNWSTLNESN